ncbi:hypothetical protein F4805DRAFT_440738 [Annulohypoxylon moriforme]|nr:hypothetical protein F4805DRAFT_440738 [Annulohypoxylon moriforme]
MSGCNMSFYTSTSGSDEAYYEELGKLYTSYSDYIQGDDQTQPQTVSLSEVQDWADVPDSPIPSFYTPVPQDSQTNTVNTGVSTALSTGQEMSQDEPIQQIYGETFDTFGAAQSYPTAGHSFGYLNELETPYGTHPEYPTLPLFMVGDATFYGTLESQGSQAWSATQANENPGLDCEQHLPVDQGEMRSIFGTPVPQDNPTEAVSSAPLQQGEALLQQLGEPQVTLPELTVPLPQGGGQLSSSQTSSQPQATTAPSSGRGRKRKVRPEEQYPTPESTLEGHESGDPQPRKKSRVVGKNSCECCRRSKVKCVHAPGMAKCQRCEEKGFDCVISGVDNRTNKTASDELHEVLNKNHALIQEFTTLLYLLSQRGACSNPEEHREALRMSRRQMNPTRILEYFDRPAATFFLVENIRELNGLRCGFERLEERRAAIKEAEEYGRRIMCAILNVCDRLQDGEISEESVGQILGDAKWGAFKHPDLRLTEDSQRFLSDRIRRLYMGEPTPSLQTVAVLPNYPKP